jgi:hypothetical protein
VGEGEADGSAIVKQHGLPARAKLRDLTGQRRTILITSGVEAAFAMLVVATTFFGWGLFGLAMLSGPFCGVCWAIINSCRANEVRALAGSMLFIALGMTHFFWAMALAMTIESGLEGVGLTPWAPSPVLATGLVYAAALGLVTLSTRIAVLTLVLACGGASLAAIAIGALKPLMNLPTDLDIGLGIAWLHVSITAMLSSATWTDLHQELQHGRCRNCGYDLTGNTTGVCPECAKDVREDHAM